MLTGLIFFGTLMVIAHSRYSLAPACFASLATIKSGSFPKAFGEEASLASKSQVPLTEPFARRLRR